MNNIELTTRLKICHQLNALSDYCVKMSRDNILSLLVEFNDHHVVQRTFTESSFWMASSLGIGELHSAISGNNQELIKSSLKSNLKVFSLHDDIKKLFHNPSQWEFAVSWYLEVYRYITIDFDFNSKEIEAA